MYSSGIGELYKKGIPVGSILEVINKKNDIDRYAIVEVFANIDSLNKHEVIYGIDGNGLDIEALIALNSSFNDYMDNFPFHKNGLWGVMEDITNKKININKLKIKYSNTQRYYINDKKLDNINF